MFEGKSIYGWNVPAVKSGNPEQIAQLLVDNKFDAVAFKAAQGNIVHYVNNSTWPGWGESVKPALVSELKAAGIEVWFWHFVLGVDPVGELKVARAQCDKFDPTGYIWDCESVFDAKPNAVESAKSISSGLNSTHPHIPQALCWWALPKSPITGAEWHPIKVAKAWLEVCKVGMPMMYWQGSTPALAVDYFKKSIKIWREFTSKPIVPVGRTYNGDGGTANPESILAFAEQVKNDLEAQNLLGVSWYSLDEAAKSSSWMQALKEISEFPSFLSVEEKVDRLVREHAYLFPELDL